MGLSSVLVDLKSRESRIDEQENKLNEKQKSDYSMLFTANTTLVYTCTVFTVAEDLNRFKQDLRCILT